MNKQNGNGQPTNLNNQELAAYTEAFRGIESDYKTLCTISKRLREVEQTADIINSNAGSRTEIAHANGSPWQKCAALTELDKNEVFLAKRATERGVEYAILESSPASSPYTKANGPHSILNTSDNPRQVLNDYLKSEREALSLFANDLVAQVRLTLAERFPAQNLSRVVKEIARLCKRETGLGQSHVEMTTFPQTRVNRVGI